MVAIDRWYFTSSFEIANAKDLNIKDLNALLLYSAWGLFILLLRLLVSLIKLAIRLTILVLQDKLYCDHVSLLSITTI